ncbi:MAG: alpha/beta hydrolase [Prevotellaceae bacterium]|nr:alpha/beta hydrolase [Prevotellaceae bacterium]
MKAISIKKRILLIVSSIILLLVLIVLGAGWYMLDYALKPDSDRKNTSPFYERIYREYSWMPYWTDSLKQTNALCDTFIVTPEGERHHALFVRNPVANGRTAILVHGYKNCSINMLPIASIYEKMGYNILLPDLHAHGLSDGDDIQMGWKDRLDVIRWIDLSKDIFHDFSDSARIVLHGVSMGAATVMNVSGEDLPDNVKCFVEDCGFSNVWDEFSHQLKDQFGLPEFPVLYAASFLCKLRYGWSFGEASSTDQLKKRVNPMLFIHGTTDDFVPSSMVFPVYNANPVSSKSKGDTKHYNEIWITPGCEHAKSLMDYPEEYSARVKNFVSKYIN